MDKTDGKGPWTEATKWNRRSKGEYEGCIFRGCDFSNSTLAEVRFRECEFLDCNLSLAKLVKTALADVTFRACKMLGLRFEDCNEFGLGLGFDDCTLNDSSFYKVKVKHTSFKDSQLREVDFTGSDLTGSVFDNCDLARAVFENTVVEEVDFRTSFNYSLDPERNRVKGAKFSLFGVIGLLDKYEIDVVVDGPASAAEE